MLANNIAIIPKYYEIKSNLLPKNTVKTVDVEENEVTVQGGTVAEWMIFSNALYLATWSDTELIGSPTTYGKWTSYTLDEQTDWANADPQMQAVSSLTAIYEQTGNLVYKFENTWGDTNAENYSVTGITHKIRPLGTSSTLNYTFNHFQGTRNHTPADDNPITPVFTFDGNWIYMTVPHCLIRGKYEIIWRTGSSRFDELFPFQFSWTINYGGFAVKTITSTFGDSDKKFPYEVSENGFYEIHSFFNEVNNDGITTQTKISQHNANTIINKWQNGKQYVECEIPMTTYYNENGDVLVAENTNKQLFEQYDLLTFKSKGVYNYIDENGNAKIFKVLQIDFVYDGGKIMKLKCIEV